MAEDTVSAPHPRQRLAVEFANTTYAVRGRPREGIDTPAHLLRWLHDHALQLTAAVPAEVTDADTARFRDLRDAIRAAAAAAVDGQHVPAEARDEINGAAAEAPSWPELASRNDSSLDLVMLIRTTAPAATAVRAEIARDAIDMFTGPDVAELQRCGSPGCILYFIKDHPRRQWCSTACGTRARVARHYRRHRQD